MLIPQQAKDDGPSGEEMAATLAFRLKRLEAMREAATRLINRNRLGRDVYARGAPEHVPTRVENSYEATLYDLLTAYACPSPATGGHPGDDRAAQACGRSG